MSEQDDVGDPPFAIRQKGLTVSDDYRSPVNLALLAYWRGKRSDRGAVAWKDVDLMELYRIAPHLTVCDVLDDGREFRARYFGTEIAQIFQFDRTGKTLAEMYEPAAAAIVAERYRLAVSARAPVRKVGRIELARQELPVPFEASYLPLVDGNGAVSQVVSGYDFTYRPVAEDGID